MKVAIGHFIYYVKVKINESVSSLLQNDQLLSLLVMKSVRYNNINICNPPKELIWIQKTTPQYYRVTLVAGDY